MKRTGLLAILTLLLSMLFAGMASAHVVVYPLESTQGAYEVFTVRVPSEKPASTTKIDVTVPADVDVSRVEPKTDWSYELIKDGSGKVTNVVWTSAKGIGATEFGEFRMQGKVGAKATSLSWKAAQTYSDGSIVNWSGDEKSQTPASVTTVKAAAAAAADSHGAAADTASMSSDSKTPLVLSIVAVVLAALALLTALFRKAR